jgi:hypothetical protein
MPDADNLTSALDAIRDRRARSTSCVSARDLPDGDNRSAASAADVPRLLAAVDAVLALHKPFGCLTVRPCPEHAIFGTQELSPDTHRNCADCVYEEWDQCAECGPDVRFPCPTYLAISRELTGGIDD